MRYDLVKSKAPTALPRLLAVDASVDGPEDELEDDASSESAMEPLAAPVEEIVSATANYKEEAARSQEATEEERRRFVGEMATATGAEGIEIADSIMHLTQDRGLISNESFSTDCSQA